MTCLLQQNQGPLLNTHLEPWAVILQSLQQNPLLVKEGLLNQTAGHHPEGF